MGHLGADPAEGVQAAEAATRAASFSPTIFDQDTARERRQKGYDVQYTGSNFVLSEEIRGLCGPLAAEMTSLFVGPMAGRTLTRVVSEAGTFSKVREVPFAAEVAELAGAVHGLLLDVARILGDRMLGSSAAGRAAAAAVVSDAVHSAAPQVTDQDVKSGAWLDVLANHVLPLDVELAAQLGRAALPDGGVSDASQALSEALGWGGTLSMKLANLERKIGESKLALQEDVAQAKLAAEERERRSQQRLQSMGLLS